MLRVITNGSNVTLPDYVWWQMLTPPPRVSIKNLSGVDITVSGAIDGGTTCETLTKPEHGLYCGGLDESLTADRT